MLPLFVDSHTASPPCATPQDFERERNPERVLQSMSLKRFAALVFRECPGLAPFAGSLDKIYKAFAEYKQACQSLDVLPIFNQSTSPVLALMRGSRQAVGMHPAENAGPDTLHRFPVPVPMVIQAESDAMVCMCARDSFLPPPRCLILSARG